MTPSSPPSESGREVTLRHLGRVDYRRAWARMREFTDSRSGNTPDELWLLEHPPVFTLGQNGRREHVLDPGPIPVIDVDRGGQVTYHGPGQAVLYPLFDLRRSGIGVRRMVTVLEQAVIALAAAHGIVARARAQAPGVYVDDAKLAAVGLRVRRGCTYHGVALNVDMDLAPFRRINPCGHVGMPVIDLAGLGVALTPGAAADELARCLLSEVRQAERPRASRPDPGAP